MCRATRGDRRICPAWVKLSFQNLGGDAHGLGLEICPLFHHLLGCHGSLTRRYRVVGSVTWDVLHPKQ